MDIDRFVRDEIVGPIVDAGIEVQEDAVALLKLACDNQLRTRSVSSEEQLSDMIGALTPDLPSAYRFKYGNAPLTFGRTVRLLADMAERWKELRVEGVERVERVAAR